MEAGDESGGLYIMEKGRVEWSGVRLTGLRRERQLNTVGLGRVLTFDSTLELRKGTPRRVSLMLPSWQVGDVAKGSGKGLLVANRRSALTTGGESRGAGRGKDVIHLS